MSETTPFWLEKPLEAMSPEEWESLCDGCGWCCLRKVEDWETGDIYHTKVTCQFQDSQTGHCTYYKTRKRAAPNCIFLTPEMVRAVNWLPHTCAYRLLAEGKPLPEWHPLISKDPDSVRQAGMSVGGQTISENQVTDFSENYMNYIIKNKAVIRSK